MNKIGKPNILNHYTGIFYTMCILLVLISILSIVIGKKINGCLTVISGCVTSFGTMLTVYVALNKPQPKIKIDVYPINKGQFCITFFINRNVNEFLRLRLVKAEAIGEGYKKLRPQKRSIETLPDNIKKEIILRNNITFKTLYLEKSPFNQLRKYNYEVKGNHTNTNITVSGTLKLTFKTNYDDFIYVKISDDNLKFNSHFFE